MFRMIFLSIDSKNSELSEIDGAYAKRLNTECSLKFKKENGEIILLERG